MALNQVGLERLNTATTKKIGTNKNLIINGAMQVAQRGTSSSSTNGIGCVDRFHNIRAGQDEEPTQAQHALTSSDTGPYGEGFRFSFHVTNGNQTSGAGTNDYMSMRYKFEAQDIANSGWNYTSATSFITFSFWIKSSVAQNFYGYIKTTDGTDQRYAYETGSLTADTWTKITKTIPGNSNLQFDSTNLQGLEIYLSQFWGTAFTDSGVSLNTWGAYASGTRMPDNTSTWWTTNDATFEITGVQLEVGSVATDFEHRSFAQELALCHRYCYVNTLNNGDNTGIHGYCFNTTTMRAMISFPVPMRTEPTYTGNSVICRVESADSSPDFALSTITMHRAPLTRPVLYTGMTVITSSITAGQGCLVVMRNNNGKMTFDAEL